MVPAAARPALLAVVAALATALLAALAPAAAQASGCARSDALVPGRTDTGLFRTTAPFEHFDASRSQVFPHTCTLREIAGAGPWDVRVDASPVELSTPYIAATRGRDELFVYGYGKDAAAEGGYVAKVDPSTLRERWRTRIPDRSPVGQWSYPGVLLVHGNGFLYAVYGNVLVKLDPATGRVAARRTLPEDPAQTGAVYNGMTVLRDGRIVAKKIERGPCTTPADASTQAAAIIGLQCGVANELPSVIVVLDPRDLRILSTTVPPEPVTGRATAARLDGRDLVYVAGRDRLYRYVVARDGKLSLDRRWGPVVYRTGQQRPGTAAGIMGDWVVVQTNFVTSPDPLTITAVHARDSRRRFTIRPFAAEHGESSWIVSKMALDAATGLIVTHDTAANRMAAVRLDPRKGLRTVWKRELRSLAFSALVGPASSRQVVIPDLRDGRESVVWLDERTGRTLARSPALDVTAAPGNIVTPGFGGRFFYTASDGVLRRLTPVRRR